MRDDGLPERRVGRCEHDREEERLGPGQRAEQDEAGAEARDDRQRQPETEKPRRDRDLVPQRAEVDPGGVAEEDEGERRLGEQLDGLARRRRIDDAEGVDTQHEPDRREHHRGGDRRAGDALGHSGEREQRRGRWPAGPSPRADTTARAVRRLSTDEALPAVEILPATVPFETVQVDCTVCVLPSGRLHVPENPVSSSEVRVPSQVVPPANRSCSALSATRSSPAVSRSILNAAAAAAVPRMETTPEPSSSMVPLRFPSSCGIAVRATDFGVDAEREEACGSADSPSTAASAPQTTPRARPSRRAAGARPNRIAPAPVTSATVTA